MPDFLNRLHIQAKTLCQSCLRQPCRYANTQRTGRQLDQPIAALHVQPIEQRRDRRRCLTTRQTGKLDDHFVERG